MINKLTQRHSNEDVECYKKYIIKCPTCGTIMNFGKDDVYKDEDDCYIHHEYIDCSECNEKIQLSDDEYFGY
jgi:phage terminase large subunit GpA-like protein